MRYAEIRLAAHLAQITVDAASRLSGEDPDRVVEASVSNLAQGAGAAWLLGEGIDKVQRFFRGGVPWAVGLGLAPFLFGKHLWGWARNKLDPEGQHLTPPALENIRRKGPRSDSKWWQRDIPEMDPQVPPYFHYEDPSYEPWYQERLREDRTSARDVAGIPLGVTFNDMIPSHAFGRGGPHAVSLRSDVAPPTVMSLYDQMTSERPNESSKTAEHSGDRTVEAQIGTAEQLSVPSLVSAHPYSNLFAPDDAESAAAIGAGRWYNPATIHSPFFDPTMSMGVKQPVEWEPLFAGRDEASWDPSQGDWRAEMLTRFQRAQQRIDPTRQTWGTNYRISNILAQLANGLISPDRAALMLNEYRNVLMGNGVPPEIADHSVNRAMRAMEDGFYGGLPQRAFEGLVIPDYEAGDWQKIRSPESKVRGPLLDEIAQREQTFRGYTPGWEPPLEGALR